MPRLLSFAKLAVLCPMVGFGSCSKRSEADARNQGSPGRAEKTAIHPADANPTQNGELPAKKSQDRTPTETERRIRSISEQIDQLEIQRKDCTIKELEKRVALNKLRGVPADTPIDVTRPGVARDSGIEGEEAAFDAYLMISLELQTLDAKESLFKEQLQRARTSEPKTAD